MPPLTRQLKIKNVFTGSRAEGQIRTLTDSNEDIGHGIRTALKEVPRSRRVRLERGSPANAIGRTSRGRRWLAVYRCSHFQGRQDNCMLSTVIHRLLHPKPATLNFKKGQFLIRHQNGPAPQANEMIGPKPSGRQLPGQGKSGSVGFIGHSFIWARGCPITLGAVVIGVFDFWYDLMDSWGAC